VVIEVLQKPPYDGQTKEARSERPNIAAALDADPVEFKRTFLSVF
jgi:hypothetical protein